MSFSSYLIFCKKKNRGLDRSDAHTNDDHMCPNEIGTTWIYYDNSWTHAGDGLKVVCTGMIKIMGESASCPLDIKSSIKGYTVVQTSGATCKHIKTLPACEAAARELSLRMTIATDDEHNGVNYDPPYCYYENDDLYFNYNGTNTGSCTTRDKCLCHEDI